MLKPIKFPGNEEPEYGTDSPVVTCESCGTHAASHFMFNAICFIGSPGNPALPPVQCPAIEHWACSIECWAKVMSACIEEHMVPYLQAMHKQLELEEEAKKNARTDIS